MSSRPRRWTARPGPAWGRGALLLAAALVLPCCDSQPGDQPTLGAVTVRVSVSDTGGEATGGTQPAALLGSLNPALSSDGRYAAFDSTATNLTPAFVNGHVNIFVKDRLNGGVLDVTNVVEGEFGPFIADCLQPAISGNGAIVAFLSTGLYTPTLGGGTNVNAWTYTVATGTFGAGTIGMPITYPNKDLQDLSLSDDGRFLSFTTAATNIVSSPANAGAPTFFANPSAGSQVYVIDLQAATSVVATQLMSPAMGSSTTGASGSCSSGHLSGDGSTVSFVSSTTNLVAAPPASGAYTSKVGSNTVKLVSIGFNPGTMTIQAANGTCFDTALSTDGSFVAFSASNVSNWGPTVTLGVYRYDANAGQAVLVAPDLISKSGIVLVPDRIGLSGDGQMLVYMRADVTVKNLQTGVVQNASVNISGMGATLQCFSPCISEDGRWAAWYTLANNLVAADNNGSNDIFVRGPLR